METIKEYKWFILIGGFVYAVAWVASKVWWVVVDAVTWGSGWIRVALPYVVGLTLLWMILAYVAGEPTGSTTYIQMEGPLVDLLSGLIIKLLN